MPQLSWKLVGIVPVILAVLIVVFLVRTKSGPARKDATEAIRALRAIKVPVVDFIPRTTGYGVAEPGKIWRAVSEVGGRVVTVHPGLKAGSLLEKDDLLLKIDPAEYELAVAEARANIARIETDIAELAVQEKNTAASLEIEKRSLELAEQSLARKKSVLKDNTIAPYEFEQEERSVLIQRQRVQSLENTLNLLPTQLKALEAELASSETNLKQAELDLTKTTISAPFDCRIGPVSIEPGQYLAAGQVLFEAYGTAVAEIETQVLGEQLRHLIRFQDDTGKHSSLFGEALAKLANITAIVRISSGSWNVAWDARVDRLREAVDPATRAFSVIVAVDNPYEKVIPGSRPPLTKGLFCEVELRGPVRQASIIIPRTALHGDTVYLINDKNRLQPVAVTIDVVQSGIVVVKAGLSGDESLVVADPAPAVAGMLVKPVWDEKLRQRLVAEAGAETDL